MKSFKILYVWIENICLCLCHYGPVFVLTEFGVN